MNNYQNFIARLQHVFFLSIVAVSFTIFFAALLSFVLSIQVSYMIAAAPMCLWWIRNIVHIEDNYKDWLNRPRFNYTAFVVFILLIPLVYTVSYLCVEAYNVLHHPIGDGLHKAIAVLFTILYYNVIRTEASITETIKSWIYEDIR